MQRMARRAWAVVVALTVLVATTGAALAGEEEGEPLVFELTLSGKVDIDDAFGVYHFSDPTPNWAFIHDVDVVCSGDDEHNAIYGLERCEERTYRLSYEPPAGVTVEYAIAFWNGDLAGDPEYLLRDSVTVPQGGITLRLTYDYARASAPTGSSAPPALPDTGMPEPGVPPGPVVALIGLAVVGVARLRSHRRRLTRPTVSFRQRMRPVCVRSHRS